MDALLRDSDEDELVRARSDGPTELQRAYRDGVRRDHQQRSHAAARDRVTPAWRGRDDAPAIGEHAAGIRCQTSVDEHGHALSDQPAAPLVPRNGAVSSWYRMRCHRR